MNPHKHPSTVAEYCDLYTFDEVLYWTGVRLTRRGPVMERKRTVDHGNNSDPFNRLELNHIFGGCNTRPDYWSNFIRMLKPGHDWFHANLSAGRMVCILTKLLKRAENDPEEFDPEEVRLSSGKFIGGIIINYEFKCPLLNRLNREALDRLAALESTKDASP